MDSFAKEDAEVRAEVFGEVAARKGVAPVIIEKDFWVCWALRRVFELADRLPAPLFKGGTSLSKGYGLIERFSEDVDISLDRHALGFADERDPACAELSGKVRKGLLKELKETADQYVGDELLHTLNDCFLIGLGAEVFSLSVDDDEAQTLLFSYPVGERRDDATLGYVKPVVRLEFGVRSDHDPSEKIQVTPYAAEEFPDLFEAPETIVKVLAAERTFWEKATILHALAHAAVDREPGERKSRHLYDLAQLARSDVRGRALQNLRLLTAVADHKNLFFRAASARYDLAKPGTLKLIPSEEVLSALEKDYRSMAEMFFAEPEPFDDVVECLTELEAEINGLV